MKWEIHIHSEEGSACGRMSARQMVEAHAARGYHGIVLTDHFHYLNLNRFPGRPRRQAEYWLKGYEAACAAGSELGLKVLFGLEARIMVNDNDYLIYGAEPDFVLDNPELYTCTLAELHALCRRYNALLVQAHPFRRPCIPADPACLDGVEVFNSNPRHLNNSDLAIEFAAQHPHLIATSGSDSHRPEDLAQGSMRLLREVGSSAEFAACLRDRAFERAGL